LNGAAWRPRGSEISGASGVWCGYGLEEFAEASLWMRQQKESEAVVLSAVGARCDAGTLCVPEQVSSRGWNCGFMRRTRGTAEESEAGVELRRGVRRRAWFRRRQGSSRAERSGYGLKSALPLSVGAVLRCGTGGSRAAGGRRGTGWRESRSCGCARGRAGAGGGESVAGTHLPFLRKPPNVESSTVVSSGLAGAG
jgi:hypothetical protein